MVPGRMVEPRLCSCANKSSAMWTNTGRTSWLGVSLVRILVRDSNPRIAGFLAPDSGSLYPAQRRVTLRKSTRQPVCAWSLTPSLLPAERVSCQHLSLRHLALGEISFPGNRASKIPSICGTLWGKLLTAEMAEKPISVSLCPTFSEAPDCPRKVRR